MKRLIYFSIILMSPIISIAQRVEGLEKNFEIITKKKYSLLHFVNPLNDSLTFGSFKVERLKFNKFKPLSIYSNTDTVVLLMYGEEAISFAHEFTGVWYIDGKSKEKELFLPPFQRVTLKVKQQDFSINSCRFIILKFKERDFLLEL